MSNAIDDDSLGDGRRFRPQRLKSDFATQYDVHPDFLSTPAKKHTLWAIFEALDGYFETLEPYQQTFDTGKLPGELSGSNDYVQQALWCLGSWPVTSGTNKLLWANPEYCHPMHTVPKLDDRMRHIEMAIKYPTIKQQTLADRFDVSARRLRHINTENDIAFRERRMEQKRRIGRSMRCTAAWTDYEVMDLAELLPVPTGTAKTWAVEHAIEDGWEAPAAPTKAKWYHD